MRAAIFLLFCFFSFFPAYGQIVRFQLFFPDSSVHLGPGVTAEAREPDNPHSPVYTGVVDSLSGLIVFEHFSTHAHDEHSGIPEDFAIGNAYPNPAQKNSHNQIRYPIRVDQTGDITVELYNILGRAVATKTYQNVQPGEYNVILDQSGLASGVHLHRATRTSRTDKATATGAKSLILPGDAEFNTKPTLTRTENTFANNLEHANYTNQEINWHTAPQQKQLQKGILQAGATYNFEIQGDWFEPLNFTLKVEQDTTIEKTINEIINGFMQNANFNEAGTHKQKLNFTSPTGPVSYHPKQTNDSLLVQIINDTLQVSGIHDDINGTYTDTLQVTAPKGTQKDYAFTAYIQPQPDIRRVLMDPILQTPHAGVTVRFGEYETISDENGKIKIQLTPGTYTMKTDTTGGRMQTTQQITLTTEDLPPDTIPVAYKNDEQMKVLIDVTGWYGPGYSTGPDDEIFATNRIWDPNKTYGEGLEKGTLRTLYINLDLIRNDFRLDHLKWAVEKLPEATGGKIRLQSPEEADSFEIEVENITDESAIMAAFDDAETHSGIDFSKYDYLVCIAQYSPDLNSSNANVVRPEYATRAISSVYHGNLGPARAIALSELLMPLQNAEDSLNQDGEEVIETLYGRPLRFNHELGYVIKMEYNGVPMPREHHIGALKYNSPLNTTFKVQEIILPERGID